MNDGFHPNCMSCKKQYYNENRDQLINYQNLYDKQNREKNNIRMNEYIKNRIKTDVNFRLIRNTRRRVHHALNGKSKSSSTLNILGIDIDSYRKWMNFNLHQR